VIWLRFPRPPRGAVSRRPRPLFLIPLLLIFAAGLQGFADSGDSLATRYEKGLNNDEWRAAFRYDKSFGSAALLRIVESANSSRLRVSPLQDKWKDQQNLALTLERRVHPNWNLLLAGDSRLFSDKQSGYANDLRTHSLDIGARYSNGWLQIPLSAGPKQDSRFGRTDAGTSFSAGLEIPRLDLSGYSVGGSASWDRDELERRKNGDTDLSLGVHRNFEAGTTDSLTCRIIRQRRDYYVSQAGEIENRNENGQELANVLNYRINPAMAVKVYGGIYTRTLTINDRTDPGESRKQRERRDFRALGTVDLAYAFRSANLGLTFSASGEDQDYWIAKDSPGSSYSGMSGSPDTRGRTTSMAGRIGGRFFGSDSLTLYTSVQKLQYDTPDPANSDDRDELRFWIDLRERHPFSGSLELRTSVAFYFLHQVYIYGEKSGDNNRIRILSLHPEIRWTPSASVRFSQAAEVLANYVEYDYESMYPGIRSFLYRKFRLEDSLWVSLTHGLSVFAQGRLELDENGKLLWSRWLEQRLIDRRSVGWTVSLDIRPFAGMRLMPGYTVYGRKGYRYRETESAGGGEPGRDINLDFRNSGPVLSVAYSSDRIFFAMTVGTTRTRTLNAPVQALTRMDVNMSWRL